MTPTQDLTKPSGWGDRAWTCPRCGIRTGLLLCLRCDRHVITELNRKHRKGGAAA
jgi:hypothetical protein